MNGYNTSFKDLPELKLVPIDPENEEQVTAIQSGIASFKSNRHLMFVAPDTLSNTREWLKKVTDASNSGTVMWGVQWSGKIVGTMSLSRKGNQFVHTGGGGKVIYDRSLDGKGISKAITMARALYAVDILDLKMVGSEAFLPNVGSWRSLWHAGYQLTGVNLGIYHLERKHHDLEFQLYLPGHPFAENVPSHISKEMMELLAADLLTYEGMDESSVKKLMELNAPRPNHAKNMRERFALARKVITFE